MSDLHLSPLRCLALLTLCALVAHPAAARSLKWVSPAPSDGTHAPASAAQADTPANAPIDTPASATDRPQGTGDYLARMDRDGDARVSLVEYQDWLSYAFDRMDANRDGVLAPNEQPGGRGETLTREQHRARVADTFRRQDRNRDGGLDHRELAAPPQAPER